jgi:uncharacterized protein YvpB
MWLRFLGWLCFFTSALTWADAQWIPVTEFHQFQRESTNGSAWISQEWKSSKPFRELVVSWNLRTDADLEVECQVQTAGNWGRWWHLGHWSSSPSPTRRTSVRGQRDSSGSVDTDTLVLPTVGQAVRLRVRFSDPTQTPTALKRMDLALWSPASGPEAPIPAAPPNPATRAIPTILEVPQKSQADYPEGVTQWCSPTSLAMLMAYWGRQTAHSEWDLDVRTVAAGVHDPGWPGTGNWSFNAAFAGSRPGLQAAAVRLGGIADLEALLNSGIPVAASVSYAVLKGGPKPENGDGHLVVVCGLSGSTVSVNDPGVRLSRVRREFPRAVFQAAWAASHQTVYVVWPEGRALPVSPLGTW